MFGVLLVPIFLFAAAAANSLHIPITDDNEGPIEPLQVQPQLITTWPWAKF
jgi:hypothetical protein